MAEIEELKVNIETEIGVNLSSYLSSDGMKIKSSGLSVFQEHPANSLVPRSFKFNMKYLRRVFKHLHRVVNKLQRVANGEKRNYTGNKTCGKTLVILQNGFR